MGKIFFYAICFLRIKEGVWEEYHRLQVQWVDYAKFIRESS